MNLYKDNDMDKTLADLGIDKKQYVYLDKTPMKTSQG